MSIFICDQNKYSNFNYLQLTLKLSLSEYQLSFKERTITDYAILENSIVYDLSATTVCFFVRHTDNKEPQNQCVYSYADAGSTPWANVLTFSLFPLLEVIVDGDKRYFTTKVF